MFDETLSDILAVTAISVATMVVLWLPALLA